MWNLRECGARVISKMGFWFKVRISCAQSYGEQRFWYRIWWAVLSRYWEAVILFYGWDDRGKGYKGW